MTTQNKIRIQVGLFSLFVSSTVLILLLLLGIELKLISVLICSLLITSIIYILFFFYVKYFLNTRLKEISDKLFSKDINFNKTVTTNMEELVSEIKQLDDKRKIELSQMLSLIHI